MPDSPENGAEPGFAVRAAFALYKGLVSPVLHAISPSQCIYLPTCSEYAYVAVARFGAVKGSWLALRRLARCRPFAKGGYDPVPETWETRNLRRAESVSIHTEHLP